METETLDRIRTFLQRPGITQTMLANAADVHPNTLIGATRGDWNPGPKTRRKLFAAVDRLEVALAA
jgi:DNA-binding XRE family transcriptional regulator